MAQRDFGFLNQTWNSRTTAQLNAFVATYGPVGTIEANSIPIGAIVRDSSTGELKVFNGVAFVAGTNYTPVVAPANTVLPVVSGDGSPVVGEVLTTTNGTWTGTPTPVFTYQWFVGGVAIAGATASTHTPTVAGSYTAAVTARNSLATTATSVGVAVA